MILAMDNKGNISDNGAAVTYFGIDDATTLIYTWVVFTVTCQMINVFGIVSNIINITCFVNHGFQESINISLLGRNNTNANITHVVVFQGI